MSGISEQTWMVEKSIAEQSLDMTGHLPTGNELGGKFWDMVGSHYELAKDTGNLARFDHYHCPFVIAVETASHTPSVSIATPYVPPEQHTPVPQPICPVPTPTPHPGHPGAVPEPSSIWLVSAAIVCGWLGLNMALFTRILIGWYRETMRQRTG
jgi:hypothetical protein